MAEKRAGSEAEAPLYVVVGTRVRSARLAGGQSQESLAKAVGLTRTSITNLESGRQQVPLHTLYAVAEALSCDIYDLLPATAPGTSARIIGKEDVARWTRQLATPAR